MPRRFGRVFTVKNGRGVGGVLGANQKHGRKRPKSEFTHWRCVRTGAVFIASGSYIYIYIAPSGKLCVLEPISIPQQSSFGVKTGLNAHWLNAFQTGRIFSASANPHFGDGQGLSPRTVGVECRHPVQTKEFVRVGARPPFGPMTSHHLSPSPKSWSLASSLPPINSTSRPPSLAFQWSVLGVNQEVFSRYSIHSVTSTFVGKPNLPDSVPAGRRPSGSCCR